jgi:hypothetical protein
VTEARWPREIAVRASSLLIPQIGLDALEIVLQSMLLFELAVP